MTLTRTILVGRLSLVTVTGDVGEAAGDPLNADETGIAVARHQPRPFSLVFQLAGIDSDVYTAGARMRRQMRAIMENSDLRLQGLYFNWTIDPELNGWIVYGDGDITYVDAATSPQFGQFQIQFNTAYKIGSLRTHRPARRIELYDRTLAYIPRDYRGVITGTDFAALRGTGTGPYLSTGQPSALPPGALAVLGAYRTPVAVVARAGIDGVGYIATGLQHATIASYEQLEANQNIGDVVIWDRKTFTAPTYTSAGDINPQDPTVGYGWEEIYGPDQPLTGSDCVVIGNGLTRVRYVAATNSFAIDGYVAGTGYVEQGRITIWDSTATDILNQHTYAIPQGQQGAYGTILEWTPERAVIRFSSYRSSGDQTCMVDTYITLQRGWLGPRFESYCSSATVTNPGVQLRYTSEMAPYAVATPFIVVVTDDGLNNATSSPGTPLLAFETWAYLQPTSAAAGVLGCAIASPQSNARLPIYNDNAAYGGSVRYGVAISARFNETQVNTGENVYGYASLSLAYGVTGTLPTFAAVTFKTTNSGISSVTDAGNNPINTNVLQSTDTASGTIALSIAAGTAAGIPLGRYAVLVRVRVASSGGGTGDTLTVTGGFTGSLIPDSAFTRTATTHYVWVYLGETAHNASSDTFTLQLYREAGSQTTPKFMLDRVMLIPTERRAATSPTLDGGRDLGGLVLYDSQAIPALVER